MISGTVLRSSSKVTAPERMIFAVGPVQSTTVDGGEWSSVPPSRTRSFPETTSWRHCATISDAAVAGSTLGLFALVDVIGCP